MKQPQKRSLLPVELFVSLLIVFIYYVWVQEKLQGEGGEIDSVAALLGALMGADADAGPVGRRLGVGPRVAILDQCAEKFVDHVRVTAAVAAALHE